MAALEAAARTVGSLYRQIASLHGPSPRCGCGWQPEPDEDLIRLEAMLAAALIERSRPRLADLPWRGGREGGFRVRRLPATSASIELIPAMTSS